MPKVNVGKIAISVGTILLAMYLYDHYVKPRSA
jgi:hypothetical protein